ncbi:iron ABC transporter permease [Azospirillum humicireducens]|uniref:Iron ABC transporter permease n=2 Tax=Azospirillum humicireducens TaxID=1226968 RepID=A0A160JCS1_9PROT|nr:iron ABC transporter permease [Azospirillum humicireducens]
MRRSPEPKPAVMSVSNQSVASHPSLRRQGPPGSVGSATVDMDTAIAGHRCRVVRRVTLLAVFTLAMLAAGLADIVTGPSGLTLHDLLRAVLAPGEVERTTAVIVWTVRLPYAVMALLVGAVLGLSGVEMQTILDNPLASPFTLGLSSAAAVGASLAIVFHLAPFGLPESWAVPALAFVFAFGSMLLLQAMARLAPAGRETLVLLGIALVFSCHALVALLQLIAPEDVLQQLVFWTLGSVTRATWEKIGILAAILALVMPFSMAAAWSMTVLRLGEDRALSFGVDVRRLRYASLVRVSLISSIAVAFVGPIGFIGLVGPHIARMLVGEDQRFLLPTSAMVGALLLSLASVASKAIMPGIIVPVGIVTALVGVPAFVLLILRQRR